MERGFIAFLTPMDSSQNAAPNAAQIEKALEEIRPMLARHLGNIEFVECREGVAYVRMLGTCRGCPLSQLTLKAGVEDMLKSKVPGISRVEAVE